MDNAARNAVAEMFIYFLENIVPWLVCGIGILIALIYYFVTKKIKPALIIAIGTIAAGLFANRVLIWISGPVTYGPPQPVEIENSRKI